MGTDIHAALEWRKNGQWHALTFKNKYFGRWGDVPEFSARLDLNRDYDMFALLGNVRNGTASAGCVTGTRFDSISDHRGVPDDISAEAKAVLSNEHSSTWVTLSEILAFDWRKATEHQGYVTPQEFEKWQRNKQWQPEPESWCGDVSGAHIQKISNEQMQVYVASKDVDFDHNLYTLVCWGESYADAGRQIWSKILPHALALGAVYGFDNVRLVMDFDS